MEGGLLSLKWNNHRSSFIHVLSSLRKKDSFCDVTLACDGKFYPSHKLVLSTCSEYFQDMFNHTQCKHPVIVLKDIKCEDLEALLNYMYLGEVNVVQEKLSTLIKAAECLKIKGLAVPDDPPKESHSEKRGSGHHDSAPESKRRRTEHDHPRNKENSKSFSKHSSKYPLDVQYKQGVPSSESYAPLSNQSTSNVDLGSSYSYDSDSLKVKERDSIFIKQEPPDNFVDLEDTKEGILQNANPTFLNPLPQEEIPNTENVGTSESQDNWRTERADDNFPPLEAEGSESANEDCNPSDNVWDGTSWCAAVPSRTTDLNDLPIHPSHSPSSSSTAPQQFFTCSVCGYKSIIRMDLLKHMRTHTGEKPFACRWCSYSTAQSSNLLKHVRNLHEKPKSVQREPNPESLVQRTGETPAGTTYPCT